MNAFFFCIYFVVAEESLINEMRFEIHFVCTLHYLRFCKALCPRCGDSASGSSPISHDDISNVNDEREKTENKQNRNGTTAHANKYTKKIQIILQTCLCRQRRNVWRPSAMWIVDCTLQHTYEWHRAVVATIGFEFVWVSTPMAMPNGGRKSIRARYERSRIVKNVVVHVNRNAPRTYFIHET